MANELVILSYNIHKGFNWSNRKFILENIKSSILESGAEIVLLQEVKGRSDLNRRTQSPKNFSNQFEYLADSIWPYFAYGKNAIYEGGHHGNLILSKYPIEAWKNFDISTNPFEQRGVLYSKIDLVVLNMKIHILTLHLNLLSRSRIKQLVKLCDIIREVALPHEPVIIGGDFNDWDKTATATLRAELGLQESFKTLKGEYAKSYPSMLPLLALDRVYFRGLKAIDAEVLKGGSWDKLSDHAVLRVKFAPILD